MNTTTVAAMLDGREYLEEITQDILDAIKGTDIVIVFGASDDLMEFRGAIHDEIGACNGTLAYVNDHGLITSECDNEDCPYFRKYLAHAKTIEAVWCNSGENPDIAWTYRTTIPHYTFDIMEDGEPYCRGIVFRLSNVKTGA